MGKSVTLALGFAVLCIAITLGSAPASAQIQCTNGVCVTTWHNDNWRTGQNTSETTLTTALVGNPAIFGRKCLRTVDGQIHAQPLVVTNVLFQGQTTAKTVAYVVTENDSVYAIDGTNCTQC